METADPFRTPLIGWVRVIFRNRASYRQVAVAALWSTSQRTHWFGKTRPERVAGDWGTPAGYCCNPGDGIFLIILLFHTLAIVSWALPGYCLPRRTGRLRRRGSWTENPGPPARTV